MVLTLCASLIFTYSFYILWYFKNSASLYNQYVNFRIIKRQLQHRTLPVSTRRRMSILMKFLVSICIIYIIFSIWMHLAFTGQFQYKTTRIFVKFYKDWKSHVWMIKNCVALKFDGRRGSSAAATPVKFQKYQTFLNINLMTMRLREILQYDISLDIEIVPRCASSPSVMTRRCR